MAVEYLRPVSHAAHWARRLGLAALVVGVGAWAATRFGPLLQPHFLALYLVACGLALVAILGGVVGIVRLWQVGAKGGKASMAAILFAIPVLAPATYAAWRIEQHAQVYDVSTDITDPPQWIATPAYDQLWLGARPTADDDMRLVQHFAYPALIAHRYDGALDRVLDGARKAAAATHIAIRLEKLPDGYETPAPVPLLPGQIPIPAMRPSGYDPSLPPPPPAAALLQGEARGFFTGFRYDIVIRLKEDGDTTLADIRVQSRYGADDAGGAAEIAGAYLNALDEALQGSPG